jgi:hypothetical protein
MRFSCEHCHRRFSTREDPVPGRVYRIGCRCGHVIVLRPGEAAAPPPLPAPRRVVTSPVGPSPSPRRAAPPPLPRTAVRAPAAHDEPPRADPAPAPCGPAATAGARRPALPELATTPTPPPMSFDDMHYVPRLPACRAPSWTETLVRAARASLGAGLAAWRSERTISRTLRAGMPGRPERTGWRTLLAGIAAWGSEHASFRTFLGACTASACVAALLAGWLVAATSRPRAETTVTARRETAAMAVVDLSAAAEESGAHVASSGAPRQRPAAARSPRLAERLPAGSDAPALEADREAAAPARAQALDAAPTSEAAALAAPTEASELAAGAPSRFAAEAATPDPAAAASDGTPPEEEAAPAATAAVVPQDAQDDEALPTPVQAATPAAAPEETQPAQDDEALATPIQAATAAAPPEDSQPVERDEASPAVEPVPAKGTLPAAASSDDRSASAGTL